MPKYRCHKEVYALQIKHTVGYKLVFVDTRYASIEVEPNMFARYVPVEGDYLVVYKNGYRSFSPKKEFEDGYSLI